ncbi:hypothetical protein B0A48_10957 [Cryoendolithus antarcticus]|uniref:Apoptosis regulator Bcl-2 family BH4 domain-containing protein n=1 Tax=Cryoendolithus antarcticus TaxID=1507870 RepID=A0A1V8SYU5_9PEZI|nr:hypothetical protein B0A48_10957 [Cryoendolithus antarcticus]
MLQIRFPSLPDIGSFLTGGGIRLPKVETHSIEDKPEKRARAIKHLLKANHINHSIIYNKLRFHNHTPHVLGSAYILGADADELNHVYEAESKHLEAWTDSPGEIARHDWRDFLGKREYIVLLASAHITTTNPDHRYQRAFIDFFEDQLVKYGYDWHALLDEFLLQGKEPLINNLIAGLGHPLIHLGYAHELSSRTIAIEALGLAACFRNDWHVYLDDPKYTRPSKQPTDSLFTILDRISHDKTFEGLLDHRGSDNITTILANESAAAAVLEHWNTWDLKNPKEQFAESQKVAVALLVAAQGQEKYDFFAVHLLTSSHAVRVLLPILPSRWHVPLVRQWWLFTLLVFIAQLRPRINIDTIKLVELDGRGWDFVTEKALKGRYRTDAHFVKALRSMREAGKTWGDANSFYLKAAVKFAEEFESWGGFGPADAEVEEHGTVSERVRRYSGEGAGAED